jgi:hypothetical protein
VQIASSRNRSASGIASFIPSRVGLSLFKESLLLAEWSTLRHTSLYVDERTCSLIKIKVFTDCCARVPEARLLQLAEIALQGLRHVSLRFQTSNTADWRI